MNTKRKNRRWRLIADVRLQGHLIFRIAAYWIICQLTLVGTLAAFNFLTNQPGATLKFVIPALVVSSLFLPIVLFDMLRFSNRFVGPVVSIKRKLGQFAETGSVETARVRPGDYYSEICDAINGIAQRFEQLQEIPTDQPATQSVRFPAMTVTTESSRIESSV